MVLGWNWVINLPKLSRALFDKFIQQFQPKIKTLIRKLERIFKRLCRQNVSLLFNQTCLNERLQPNYTHTHTHTHTHIYIYIYIYMCVCVCVHKRSSVCWPHKRETDSTKVPLIVFLRYPNLYLHLLFHGYCVQFIC